jgi:hypothetical protein
MENHPIPQDVTGFKFKIIGSITIKQFGYLLAAGIFAAIVLFVLPISGFIKIPLAFLSAVAGVGLAFIPIDGRPMDMMLVNFAKAVQAETRFVYRKTGTHMLALDVLQQPNKPMVIKPTTTANENKLENKRMLLQQAFQNSYTKIDDENAQAVGQILSSFNNPTQQITVPEATAQPALKHTLNDDVKAYPVSIPTQSAPSQAQPTPFTPPAPVQPQPQQQSGELAQAPMEVIQKEEAKIKQDTQNKIQEIEKPDTDSAVKQTLQEIQKEIQDVQSQEQTQGKTTDLEEKIKQLQEQLNTVLSEKESLEKRMYTMVNKRPDEPAFAPSGSQASAATAQSTPTTPNATVANNSSQQFQAGFPTLPDIPNVVLGIVRDPRGKVLQNILVEVVDENETPVRAFKTNALGQFASATPLSNGSYKVFFEDPQKKHEFDTIEITLDGKSIFYPLEVTSVDQREKLRRELFTAPTVTN